MGISGLLPFVEKASKMSHLSEFSGCTVAIDGYCWLHKGAYGCAEKLATGKPASSYIKYCTKYIDLLESYNIKTVVVLDGRNLPSKENTELQRSRKRLENVNLARQFLEKGNEKEAKKYFDKCVDITPAMARLLIKELRSKGIDYIVAPYEADPQLAFFAISGRVDLVISEDSDLILFGCPRILYKLKLNGNGVLYEQSKLHQCLGLTPEQFQFEKFRWMCIMSGCDYLASLPGIGLKRAKKVILESNQQDGIRQILLSIPNFFRKIQVSENYINDFFKAENTFLYQLVFDTCKRIVVPLNPYPEGLEPTEIPYAGTYLPTPMQTDLALGNLDIDTLQKIDCFEPLESGYRKMSIWWSHYKTGERVAIPADKQAEAVTVSGSESRSRYIFIKVLFFCMSLFLYYAVASVF